MLTVLRWLAGKVLSDKALCEQYVASGVEFADAVSYLGLGECEGFRSMLNRWAQWERAYAQRGFRTICLDDLFEGLNGTDLKDKQLVKREQSENPVFYAQIYREDYLGNVRPAVNLDEVMQGKMAEGSWHMPSIPDLSQKERKE